MNIRNSLRLFSSSSNSVRWIKYLINNESSVLYDIPAGKKYLTQSNYVNQPEQKGLTCWYYTMCHLRPRIGKHSFLTQKSSDKNIIELQKIRSNEEIISSFKKKKNRLDIVRDLLTSDECNTIDYANNQEKIDTYYREQEKIIDLMDKESEGYLQCRIIIDWMKFLNMSKYTSMKDHVSMCYWKEKIDLVKANIVKLGSDPEIEFKCYIEGIGLHEQFFDLPLHEQSTIAHIVFENIVKRVYGLQRSTWNPSNSFPDFINEIRHQGPLLVGGLFGRPFGSWEHDEKLPSDIPPNHSYRFFISKYTQSTITATETAPDDNKTGHYILIIGAELIQSNEQSKEIVYFIDPTCESKVSEPRSIGKMSYKDLTTYITDYYGRPKSKLFGFWLSANIPFAHYANNDYMLKTEEMANQVFKF